MALDPLRRRILRAGVRDYRSLVDCDVRLAPLSVLMGPNGCGKSSFLDALGFVAEAARGSLTDPLRRRGSFREVVTRGRPFPASFSIGLDLALAEGRAEYRLTIGSGDGVHSFVERERCTLWDKADRMFDNFEVSRGSLVEATMPDPPEPVPDRLYLSDQGGRDRFREVRDFLAGMAFYRLDPEAMGRVQPSERETRLRRDGGNIAAVLAALETDDPERRRRIEGDLVAYLAGISGVAVRPAGPDLVLEFTESWGDGRASEKRFYGRDVSDGTLQMLGLLTALYQGGPNDRRPSLVGFEEPENALHPTALGALVEALNYASHWVQVLATTHSVELLDQYEVPTESLLAVSREGDQTRIGRLHESCRDAIRDHRFTAGQLLRMGAVEPEPHGEDLRAL